MFDLLFSERGLSLDRLKVLIEVRDALATLPVLPARHKAFIHSRQPTPGPIVTESPSDPRALIRTILPSVGIRRSPNQAQACDTLFVFLDEAQAIR